MTVFSTRRLAVFVLLAVFAVTLSGCWNPFAPDKGDPVPIPPADYHDRLTPEDVLHNLKTAYIWKHVDPYLDCLSEDFTFYPSEEDLQNPDPDHPMPEDWSKAEERAMHINMFTGANAVESITLTLTEITSVFDEGDPGDIWDDTWTLVEGVDLMVNLYGDLSYLATAPSEYHLRRDIDQPTENDGSWWEIYAWFDLSERGGSRGDARQDPNIEHVSLSQLKNMFRE
ncbi:MAG: hypothetical protein KAW67_02060 [Candidatus Eisenbacteria sp.]|nr:hypothetical protein [Candidatus Eisenbacteria bacterium]